MRDCIWCAHAGDRHEVGGPCLEGECKCLGYAAPRATRLWRCNQPMGDGMPCGFVAVSVERPPVCARGHEAWLEVAREGAPEVVAAAPTPEELSDAPRSDLAPSAPKRSRMPGVRAGVNRVFRLRHTEEYYETVIESLRIAQQSRKRVLFYVTANVDEGGRLREVFLKADKQGSLLSGVFDAVAVLISLLLQYGVPLGVITSKLRHTRYPPEGLTEDQEFRSCTSPLDLVAQWLEKRFGCAT